TSGEASASFAGQAPDAARSEREKEAAGALSEVGLNRAELDFLRIPEKTLSGADPGAGTGGAEPGAPPPGLADLTAALSAFQPDLVYSPSPGDGHRVHASVAGLVSAAVAAVPSVERVALYEVMT